jgi:LysR family transcriptional regulator, low CO2-responsive transcriptional regulator
VDNRISLYKLQVFCLVVDRRSVTRAAAELGIAQPVVTAHLRSLERRLGMRLFERVGRGIRPTPAGEIAADWARDLTDRTRQAAAALDALRATDETELTVVTSINGASNGIAQATVRFQATHPETRLRLRALPTEQAVAAVLRRECDYAVVSYLAGVAVDPALRVRRLVADELVLVAAQDLAREAGDAPDVTALRSLPFVCTPAGSARRRMIDAALSARGVNERTVVMEVGSEEPFHAALHDGIGCALLSRRSAADELATGRLIEMQLPGGPIGLGIDLVWHRDLELIGVRRTFRGVLSRQLASPADR